MYTSPGKQVGLNHLGSCLTSKSFEPLVHNLIYLPFKLPKGEKSKINTWQLKSLPTSWVPEIAFFPAFSFWSWCAKTFSTRLVRAIVHPWWISVTSNNRTSSFSVEFGQRGALESLSLTSPCTEREKEYVIYEFLSLSSRFETMQYNLPRTYPSFSKIIASFCKK